MDNNDEIDIDPETMKMAIVLTIKKKVEVLFSKAQEENDLLEASKHYREIADIMSDGHRQLESVKD